MTTIVTRSGKGSPLTNNEVDANFTNLKTTADAALPLSGGSLSGNLSLGDNVKAQFGASNDLEIYHDGSASYIEEKGTGSLYIKGTQLRMQATDGTTYLEANDGGAVTLKHSGTTVFNTTSTGISISNDANFPDNGKAIFGASSDLLIFHDGTNSHIRDQGTGNLIIRGNNLSLQTFGGASYLEAAVGGSIDLYHNNSKKLQTTSTGIDITGSVTADGLTVDGGGSFTMAGGGLKVLNNGTAGYNANIFFGLSNQTDGWTIGQGVTANDGVFRLYDNGGAGVKMSATAGGDISFYEDTGTTPKMVWDASDESLSLDKTASGVTKALKLYNNTLGANNRVGIDFHTANTLYGTIEAGYGASAPEMNLKVANAQILKLISTGIDVTGTVVADGLTVETTTPVIDILANSNEDASLRLRENGTGIVGAEFTYDGGDNYLYLKVGNNTNTKRLAVSRDTGDISFYNDSAAQGFHYDSSESVLSLGRTNGSSYVTDSDSLYVKGQIRVDGISNTAALPALCFNDTNTGIFYPATNSIGFSVGAYESLRLNADGSSVFSGAVTSTTGFTTGANTRVQSSSGMLFVTGAAATVFEVGAGSEKMRLLSTGLAIGTTSAVSSAQLTVGGTSRIAPVSGNGLLFASGGSDRMFISTSGSVGINDSNPSNKLTVNSNSGAGIKVYGADQAYSRIAIDNLNGQEWNLVAGTAGASNSGFGIYDADAGATRLQIDSSGNVGIGTNSPNIAFFGKALTITDPASTNQIPAIELAFGSNTRGANIAVDNRASVKAVAITAVASDLAMTFGTNNTERMRIDSSGRVGIGTSTNRLGERLTVNGNGILTSSAENTNMGLFGTFGSSNLIVGAYSNIPVEFRTNNVERMRIDSSGNLLVGTTDAALYNNTSGSGTMVNSFGRLDITRNDVMAIFNRNTSDGTIIDFRKDGTAVGSIGTTLGGLYIADAGVGFRFDSGGTDDIIPCNATGAAADASINLGSSGARFKDLHLSGTANVGSVSAINNITANGVTIGASDVRSSSGILTLGGTSENARFSGGNLLVGKSVTTFNTTGMQVDGSNGNFSITSSGATTAFFNRTSSDGTIAQFYRDGTEIGSIGTETSNSDLYIGNGDTAIMFHDGNDAIFPHNASTNASRDAAIDIGYSSYRFKDLYLSGGIQLGGTGSANKLDDYEEGTFTPTIIGTGTNPTVTYGTRIGKYTKVGNLVTVYISMKTTSFSGGSGNLLINDLPFTASSDSSGGAPMFYRVNSFTETAPFINVGTAYVLFVGRDNTDASTAWSVMQTSAWTAANPTLTQFTMTYFAS